MIFLIGVALVFVGFKIHKKNQQLKMRRIYYNAMLNGETFTEVEHKQILKWIGDAR